jgi:hypothetical protein
VQVKAIAKARREKQHIERANLLRIKWPISSDCEVTVRGYAGIYDYSQDLNHGGKIPNHATE